MKDLKKKSFYKDPYTENVKEERKSRIKHILTKINMFQNTSWTDTVKTCFVNILIT